MVQDVGLHVKLNIGLQRRKMQQEEGSFYQQIGLTIKEETKKSDTFGAEVCVVLKLGRFGQQIRNTWKVLKCGAGKRLAGPIVCGMKCCIETRSRGISCKNKKQEGRLNELVTSCVGTAVQNRLLEGGRVEGEEIEVRVRRGRRRKQLLDELKKARRCSKLREEALDRTV